MTRKSQTILHAIDTTGPGGAEAVFLDLAENLTFDGYQSLALITGSGWVQSQLEIRSIPFKVLKPTGFFSIPYYFQLLKLMRKHNIQIVQCHLLGSALTFAILNLITRIPVIATIHGQVDVDPDERFFAIKRLLLKFGILKIVAVSSLLAEYLMQRKLFKKEQVCVIHNGVNVEKYSVPSGNKIRESLELHENSILIGSLGNIRPAKDYANLIQAAKVVIDSNLNIHFVVAGHSKEPLQSQLNELADELGISSNIHFLGFQNDSAGFLSQLDVFVLSSITEGFSIATIEAMAAKIPVIVTRCGGPEEIIEPNVDGLIVPVDSYIELAKAIDKVLKMDSREMVERAYKKTKAKFDSSLLISKYGQIITPALKSNKLT